MPGSSFGRLFRVTSFGESHGPAVGVVVDGVPAGLPLSQEDIAFELSFRRPGRLYVSGRREKDEPEILSGIFNGRTTGAPIAILVRNTDVISSLYEEVRIKPRPGHADLPFIFKYGYDNWDYRGGGRSSARETVGRVAAGAIAKKLIMVNDTVIAGYLRTLGPSGGEAKDFTSALCSKYSPVRAPDRETEEVYEKLVKEATVEGDSYGGIAEVFVNNVPRGLGEPVFDKIKADLAKAIMSIPAVTGFEYGLGFRAASMKGSEANDEIVKEDSDLRWVRNSAGGILGGITNGEMIVFRCSFKPTSSIRKPQRTVDLKSGESSTISVKGRHDPAVAIRGVTVAESMAALVMADHMLRNGNINPSRLDQGERDRIQGNWERYVKECGRMQESQ